jgi:leukotriene-A4 hydrolase
MKVMDPHSYADLDQGRIEHIDFRIRVHFETRTLHIIARYSLDHAINGSFYLDTRDLDLKRVQSDEQEIFWEIDQSDALLGERLHLRNLKGISSFTIECSTRPAASALQWLEPQQTAGGEHPYLYSQCQALHARSIFPCQDTPSVRFTYSADVEVPTPLVAVFAAAHAGSQIDGEVSRFRFRMPQPIPSYLFAFAVGNISFRSISERCGVYSEPEVIEAALWEFAENEHQIEEAETLFGPYVWERYDLLIMPPSFPYGGMENPRLTFVSPIYLVGDRSDTIIVTHELAHAWTGNLVTNATWEDFWLNEGWTTYAQTRITEALEGRDYAHFRAILSRTFMFEDMQQYGMNSPITCLWFPMRGIDPDEVFSSIPYHKGNAFLTHLEETVGRETFDAFTKKYINTYRFKSLTTSEFVTFLEQELPQVSEEIDLQKWLYRPGFPENAPLLASHSYDDVVSKVEAFNQGQLLEKEDVAGWKPCQIQLFLRLLPERISIDACRQLEKLFMFKETSNIAPLIAFYALCIRSGYQNILPGVEHLIATMGRFFFLSRIFRAMIETDWSRQKVRLIFERYRNLHHPITVSNIEKLLTEARL